MRPWTFVVDVVDRGGAMSKRYKTVVDINRLSINFGGYEIHRQIRPSDTRIGVGSDGLAGWKKLYRARDECLPSQTREAYTLMHTPLLAAKRKLLRATVGPCLLTGSTNVILSNAGSRRTSKTHF